MRHNKITTLISISILLLIITSFNCYERIEIYKEEAFKAYDLINDVRANPNNYFEEFKLAKHLKINNKQLVWNDTLARIAEGKAYDMAKRNYFDHVDPDGYGINYFINKAGYKLESDWLTSKSDNYFESICAGSDDGHDTIKTLIIDDGVPSFGHRNHLLGIEDWNSTLVDIGIGFVRCESGCEYNTYVSVIIAKHHW
jgi:uncharacterized protein YkwD